MTPLAKMTEEQKERRRAWDRERKRAARRARSDFNRKTGFQAPDVPNPAARPSTVEEFLAAGGTIEVVPTGWASVKPKFNGHRTYNDMSWRAALESV